MLHLFYNLSIKSVVDVDDDNEDDGIEGEDGYTDPSNSMLILCFHSLSK